MFGECWSMTWGLHEPFTFFKAFSSKIAPRKFGKKNQQKRMSTVREGSWLVVAIVLRQLKSINTGATPTSYSTEINMSKNIPSSGSSYSSSSFLLWTAFFDFSLYFFIRVIGSFFMQSPVASLVDGWSNRRLFFLVLGIFICLLWFEFYPCGSLGLL